MLIEKKRMSHRISVWTLIFALMLTIFTSALALPTHAETFSDGMTKSVPDMMDDAGNAVGDAVENAGDAVGDAVENAGDSMGNVIEDMADMDGDGRIGDHDGIIGNEQSETEQGAPEGGGIGWVGIAVALTIAVAVISLIVILVPKKRHN